MSDSHAARRHRVAPGDSLVSLAARYGIPLSKLQDENTELLARGRHAGALHPGDEVLIPPKVRRSEAGATEQRHRFRARRPRAEVRIRIAELGIPRADEAYRVVVDGRPLDEEARMTSSDGLARFPIPADAQRVTIVIGEYEDEYELEIGHVDPIDTPRGMHGRLKNLGLYGGRVDGPYDAESRAAASRLVGRDPAVDTTSPESLELRSRLEDAYGS